MTDVDLSVMIVSWNTKALTLQTLNSLYKNQPLPYNIETIVVDNGSSDDSVAAIAAAYPNVTVIANSDNRGFGPANNQALAIAKGKYSLLLNSDVVVQPHSLKPVLDFMEVQPDVGLCGIQILNHDGSFQGSYATYLNLLGEFLILSGLGRRLFNPHYPSYDQVQSQQSKPVQTIQGAFMCARTCALKQIGGLDERFFMYGEENDLSLRLYRAGWLVYYLAEATIIHLGGQSTRKNWNKMVWQLQHSKALLFKKHYGSSFALVFKLLVTLTVTAKWLIGSLRRRPLAWLNWADFYQFWTG